MKEITIKMVFLKYQNLLFREKGHDIREWVMMGKTGEREDRFEEITQYAKW